MESTENEKRGRKSKAKRRQTRTLTNQGCGTQHSRYAWKIAREQSDTEEGQGSQDQGPGVEGGDAPEFGLQDADGEDGGDEAQEDAGADQDESAAKNEFEDVAGLRAAGHANTELVSL
jgi:hypothetical protein